MEYNFVGKDCDNNIIKGQMDCLTKDELTEYFYKQNIYIKRILKNYHLFKPRLIKDHELINFIEEWYSLELAKINTQDAIATIKNNTVNKKLKNNLQLILLDLNQGYKLTDAFDRRSSYFPQVFLEIIKIGLDKGEMANTLATLLSFYKEQNDLNSKIKNALIYPKILLLVFFAAFLVICKFIVPSFYSMFNEAHVELGKLTFGVMRALIFIGNNLLYIILIILFVIILYTILKNTYYFKYLKSKIEIKVSKKKNLYYTYLFCKTLSLLWHYGYPKTTSMMMVANIIPNAYISKRLIDAKDDIEKGMLIGDALNNAGLFDETLSKMLIVGETTNYLENNMQNAANYYHFEYSTKLNRFIKLIEPAIIVIMALLISFVILVIFIPMLNAFKLVM